MSRPATWPEGLRQVADWLDLTDPIVIEYVDSAEKRCAKCGAALRAVEGKEMQSDLRALADKLEGKDGDDFDKWAGEQFVSLVRELTELRDRSAGSARRHLNEILDYHEAFGRVTDPAEGMA